MNKRKQRIYNREGTEAGIILGSSRRYCAACGSVSPCYLVRWPDGKRTKPCQFGVRQRDDGALQIQ